MGNNIKRAELRYILRSVAYRTWSARPINVLE